MDYRLNPDWYRVKYSLASQYATWASDPDDGEKVAHIASAEQCATELIDQIDETLGQRRWGREVSSSSVEELRAFISDEVRPNAEVLLAEIAVARQAQETVGAGEVELKEVEPAVREVEEKAAETSELSYSLARFYAQGNSDQQAQEYLKAAIERAEPDGWQALAHRIARDPVLFEVTPPSTRSVEGFSLKLTTARQEAGVEAQAEAQDLD